MFSAKNYGLPKDLIEAAKRVHEKQLEEQQVPIIRAPEKPYKVKPSEASPETIRAADENDKKALKDLRKYLPPLPVKNPNMKKINKKKSQTKEGQLTEEELAEAFAIFLEENFHVEMLTEEDLDYVFENEFPQWLEEAFRLFNPVTYKNQSKTPETPENQTKRYTKRYEDRESSEIPPLPRQKQPTKKRSKTPEEQENQTKRYEDRKSSEIPPLPTKGPTKREQR